MNTEDCELTAIANCGLIEDYELLRTADYNQIDAPLQLVLNPTIYPAVLT